MAKKTDKPLVYVHRLEWVPYDFYMTPQIEARLASFAQVRNHGKSPDPVSSEQMAQHLAGVSAVLSLNGSRADEITPEALAAAGTVKCISVSHWWGQYNDLAPKWRAAGVEVIDASYPCNQAVAEWALGALIWGLRQGDVYDRRLKGGEKWPTWQGTAGQLNGSTVGMVALGRTGRWLLQYLKPFDVRVLAFDPYLDPKEAKKLGVELVDLDTLLKTSDAISLHAPVTPQTTGMIGKRELALIRDGALLVNSARAALLDNAAFRQEMQSGRFRAYLDVFEPEPPPEDDVLRKCPNVVMTPHVAGTTQKMFHRCALAAIAGIRKCLKSHQPKPAPAAGAAPGAGA